MWSIFRVGFSSEMIQSRKSLEGRSTCLGLVPDVVKLTTKISNQTCLYLYLANTLLCALFLFWGCKSSHNLVSDGNVIWSSMTVFLGCAHSYLAQNKLFLNLFRSRTLFTTSIRYHRQKKKNRFQENGSHGNATFEIVNMVHRFYCHMTKWKMSIAKKRCHLVIQPWGNSIL